MSVGDRVYVIANEKRLRSIGAMMTDISKIYRVVKSDPDPWGLCWQLNSGYWYARDDLKIIPVSG